MRPDPPCDLSKKAGQMCNRQAKFRIKRSDGAEFITCFRHLGPACVIHGAATSAVVTPLELEVSP